MIPHIRSYHLSSLCSLLFAFAAFHVVTAQAEPVVVKGAWIPQLLNRKISEIRVANAEGTVIPFQIDEVTPEGEYVLSEGKDPNADAGNGVLDSNDEILFMREDAGCCGNDSLNVALHEMSGVSWMPVYLKSDEGISVVYIGSASSLQCSDKRYIAYDHSIQEISTPFYFARFAPDRFHFLRAGIIDEKGRRCALTRELRVEIALKALWGLLPIHYTEDNLVCYVKRYKAGPIRCIRRGDFHLRLGLGLKGSRAAVNQICYPRMVSVPVKVHIPVKFSRFFSDAWMEMTPVIDTAGQSFAFRVPECGIEHSFEASSFIDTLYQCMPVRKFFTVTDGNAGYGWYLDTDMPDSAMKGSGFVVRPTLQRQGIALCGFRLIIREVQKGRYTVTNRVFFPGERENCAAVKRHLLTSPCRVITASCSEINPAGSANPGIEGTKND